MAIELSPKQRRFVSYIVAGDTNADAHKKAGYGKGCSDAVHHVNGCKVVKSPRVARAIERANKAALVESDTFAIEKANQDCKVRIIQELELIAFTGEVKSDSARMKALELLGKHYKMFTDKVEHGTAKDSLFVFNIIKPDRPDENEAVD